MKQWLLDRLDIVTPLTENKIIVVDVGGVLEEHGAASGYIGYKIEEGFKLIDILEGDIIIITNIDDTLFTQLPDIATKGKLFAFDIRCQNDVTKRITTLKNYYSICCYTGTRDRLRIICTRKGDERVFDRYQVGVF